MRSQLMMIRGDSIAAGVAVSVRVTRCRDYLIVAPRIDVDCPRRCPGTGVSRLHPNSA